MTTTTLMKKPIATRSFAALPKVATRMAMTGISAAMTAAMIAERSSRRVESLITPPPRCRRRLVGA